MCHLSPIVTYLTEARFGRIDLPSLATKPSFSIQFSLSLEGSNIDTIAYFYWHLLFPKRNYIRHIINWNCESNYKSTPCLALLIISLEIVWPGIILHSCTSLSGILQLCKVSSVMVPPLRSCAYKTCGQTDRVIPKTVLTSLKVSIGYSHIILYIPTLMRASVKSAVQSGKVIWNNS